MIDLEALKEQVRGPGKFEGEAPYVPYFWGHGLEGMADDDDGETFTFQTTPEERETFAEWGLGDVVRLAEDEQGFVWEV